MFLQSRRVPSSENERLRDWQLVRCCEFVPMESGLNETELVAREAAASD